MSDLKPCPFCGAHAERETLQDDDGEPETLYACSEGQCPAHEIMLTWEYWNSRPIEDALTLERDKLKAELVSLNGRAESLFKDLMKARSERDEAREEFLRMWDYAYSTSNDYNLAKWNAALKTSQEFFDKLTKEAK